MENPNITDSHSVTNKVEINLHMLRLLMLNRVGGEVDVGVVTGPPFCTKKFKDRAIILFNFELEK
jgi:hypothetical protein